MTRCSLPQMAAALLAVGLASLCHAQNTDAPAITIPGAIPGGGIVIDHYPKSSGIYIGSPSIAILPNGDYVASHDLFGPNSGEFGGGTTPVFRSSDRGLTWKQIATVKGQYWSNLFVHDGELYLFGTSAALGDLVIRKSADGGVTWTEPTDESTGLLKRQTEEYGFHTSSMPMLIHNGRIWRAYEAIIRGQKWATQFRAGMCSAPVDSDLLNADNWTHTNWLANDKTWLAGKVGFNGWLEGNAVAAPNGEVLNIMRVDVGNGEQEVAAHLHVVDEHTMEFNASRDIHPMPGAAKKFNIRYCPQTKTYWTVASIVNDENYTTQDRPAHVRNLVAIMQSPDLINWTVEREVIKDLSDVKLIGFQYLDWHFDGRDIIAACRTAYPDGEGGADNYHNANFLTFHRFADVLPPQAAPAN